MQNQSTIKNTAAAPTSWVSQFAGRKHPAAEGHAPGWNPGAFDGTVLDGDAIEVFRSEQADFGLIFIILENRLGQLEVSMLQADNDWVFDSYSDVLDLSDRTRALSDWLDECAEIAAWALGENLDDDDA